MSSHRQPSSGETAPRQRQLLPHTDPVSPFHRLQPLQPGDNEQVAASPAEVRLLEGAAGGQAVACEDPCAVEGADEAFLWAPSLADWEAHQATHLPFRIWCPECVKERRDNPAHHTVPAKVRDVPEVGMDYCCFRRADCEDKITVLFQKDRASKAIRSQIVESKGVKCEEAIEAALRGIREFGHHGKIALKADGENAVKALKGEVLRRLDGGGFSIQPPAHEHESNGGVENGVKIFKGLFRVRLLALERNIDAHITINHSILWWLVEFVGDLASKYLVGVDGKTVYERLFGKKVREEQLEFGELVLWRKPRLQDYGVVAEARW